MTRPPSARDASEPAPGRQTGGELISLAFEHGGVGLLVWDADGRPAAWNRLAAEWLGIGKGDHTEGGLPPHYPLLATDGAAPLTPDGSPLAQAARGATLTAVEFGVAVPGAPPIHLLANATPLKAQGVVRGTVLTLQNVTPQVSEAHALRKARTDAESASAAKSMFLSSLTHELRTPLSAILGFAHLLAEEATLPAEQAAHLDVINKGGAHLLDIVNQVLDLARIEAGRQEVQLGPVAVAACVREVVTLLRQRADEKGVRLEATCDFPGAVRTDGVRLRQVLVNLMSNAIKFTPSGAVTVRLDVQPPRSAGGPQWLVAEVADSGPGIAPEDIPHLFEPFYRGRSPSLHSGTGLGLTITRQFVELLGGTISVASAPGAGTSIRVELPVEAAADLAPSRPPARIEGGARGCRVLVVEDQAPNALFLRRILERAGFEVNVAPNGQVGVEAFQAWGPRFIWMDIMMPVMDGLEATRAIRALPGGAEVRIVAISARSFEADRAEALAAGCDEFVSKPCLSGTVLDCMARHLALEPAPAAAPAAPSMTETTAIAALPDEAKRQLRNAVLSLERRRMVEAIALVRESAPAAATQLAAFVDGYKFTALLEALALKST